MSIRVKVRVVGQKELEDALRKLPAELVSNKGGVVKTALFAAMAPVQVTAKSTVPNRDNVEDTGRLANAVTRKRVSNPKFYSEAIMVIVKSGKNRADTSGAWYGPFVEFGSRGLAAAHWLRNAMDSNNSKSLGIYRTRLAGGIARIAKKIGDENTRKVAQSIKRL